MIAKPHQSRRLQIVIVSPALAAANNGNWQQMAVCALDAAKLT